MFPDIENDGAASFSDRWDAAALEGRGGLIQQELLTRKELFIRSVIAAKALAGLGLEQGDRIRLYASSRGFMC